MTDHATKHRVALAAGDGIGPEIADATVRVLEAAGANVQWVPVSVGKAVYDAGNMSGVEPAAWDVLADVPAMLKGPITTPQGGGAKSVNVTLRKTLGLFANVRPCQSYLPYVAGSPGVDVLIVRENEEDTYAGIEHRQTPEVAQCLKLISRPGSERVVRQAFELARAQGREKVTCMTKDNIHKITDGLFRRCFEEVAAEYSDLEHEHLIVDIGAARLADTPERFDVLVTLNLYGDILSDIAAQVAGSVGLAGSANLGGRTAMFEAIHGSAPDIAGKGVANPSGMLRAATMMLAHLGEGETAAAIDNAWLTTLEQGVHTADVFRQDFSKEQVGTAGFADAVIARLGQTPRHLPVATPAGATTVVPAPEPQPRPAKAIIGVDVFVDWDESGRDAAALAERLMPHAGETLRLALITNRGVKVWPEGNPATFKTDHWRCRFRATGETVTHDQIAALLGRLAGAGVDFIKTEQLVTFDGKPAFSAAQGE